MKGFTRLYYVYIDLDGEHSHYTWCPDGVNPWYHVKSILERTFGQKMVEQNILNDAQRVLSFKRFKKDPVIAKIVKVTIVIPGLNRDPDRLL